MMADDWQVGDKIVCVTGGPIDPREVGPRPWPVEGDLYEVGGFRSFPTGEYVIAVGAPDNIDLDGLNWGPLWFRSRFRKIRPDKHEPCEDEFVTLIKREQVRA